MDWLNFIVPAKFPAGACEGIIVLDLTINKTIF